jgi:hypothetical protein
MHSLDKQTARSNWTTASQLAEMGFCEQKLVFKHRLGPRLSRARREARLVGTAAHHRFLTSAFAEQPTVISSFRPLHLPHTARLPSLALRLLRVFHQLLNKWPIRKK